MKSSLFARHIYICNYQVGLSIAGSFIIVPDECILYRRNKTKKGEAAPKGFISDLPSYLPLNIKQRENKEKNTLKE